jgi:hypothetical protein
VEGGGDLRKRFLGALAAGALVIGMLVGGVSAGPVTDATVFLAHGIPGQKVDVYIAGDEVLSNWKYGKVATLENVAPGVYKVRVRTPAQSGKGTLLVGASLEIEAGDNVTVVAYLKSGDPFLQAFDNDVVFADIGAAILQVRHTAKAPKATRTSHLRCESLSDASGRPRRRSRRGTPFVLTRRVDGSHNYSKTD